MVRARKIYTTRDNEFYDILFKHDNEELLDSDTSNITRDYDDGSYESIRGGNTPEECMIMAKTILLVREDINYVAILKSNWGLDTSGHWICKNVELIDELFGDEFYNDEIDETDDPDIDDLIVDSDKKDQFQA